MSNPLPAYKRRALEQRHAQLVEEYEAVMNQLSHALGAVDELKLKRQAEAHEAEIADVEAQLGLDASPSPTEPQSEKASSGSAPSPDDAPFGTGDRWAVLVGANQYTDPIYPPLQVCVKDVEAIHQQLLDAGYDPASVRLLTDDTDPLPTRAKVLSAVKQMARAAARDDLVLFYYSGHGDVLDGKSYLVAREGEAAAPEYTAVALDEVAEILKGSEARAKVIILDACHSGANFEGKGPKSMPPEFIERVFKQAKGQVVLASCEQGQFSYEWQAQERSVFTHFLLEALAGEADFDGKQLITVQDVNRYVSNGVRRWAFQHGKSQTPTLQGAMAGDIILVQL
jgi:hypothetical protein